MTVDKKQKSDIIQAYFDRISKLNHFRIDDREKAQVKLTQFNKEINSIAANLESSRQFLSALNVQKQSELKNVNVSKSFSEGLTFDIKDFWRHVTSFHNRLTVDEFGLRDFSIYSLVVIFLLLIILLICFSNFLDVCISFFIAILFYIVFAIKASQIRIKNLLKKSKQEQKRKCEQDIANLEDEYKQLKQNIFALETFLDDDSFNSIKALEIEVEDYLQEDLDFLVERGKQALNIKDFDGNESLYPSAKLLQRSPIISFVGKVSGNAKDSSVIITDREISQVENKSNDKYINPEDYFKEKSIDGRIRHSVYEFVVIFLCDNVLSYYRCYWNFLKRASVDEETCEYLYDSIVSIKTQDKSSLRSEDLTTKRTYREFLSITTMDGNVLYIRLDKDRKEKILSTSSREYISDLDSAAHSIRYWLRQRRVDYFRVEDRNQ
jgi:hypothetical protein